MIKFRCPYCNQKIGVPDEYTGHRIRCSKCQQPGMVPSPISSESRQNQTGGINLELEPEDEQALRKPEVPKLKRRKKPATERSGQVAESRSEIPFTVMMIWRTRQVIRIGSLGATIVATLLITAMITHMSWAVFTTETASDLEPKSAIASLSRNQVLEMIEDQDLMVFICALDLVEKKKMPLNIVKQMYLVQMRDLPEQNVPRNIQNAYQKSYDHYDALNQTQRIFVLQSHYDLYIEYIQQWKKEK